jgi:hypothetical protein
MVVLLASAPKYTMNRRQDQPRVSCCVQIRELLRTLAFVEPGSSTAGVFVA